MRYPLITNEAVLQADPSVLFRIHQNLWIGSAPPIGYHVGKYFDCLALCAVEYQCPECFPGVEITQAFINDDGSRMTREEMFQAVRAAGKVISWLGQGKSVLVTCQAGRNRSGLVCALTLCRGPLKLKPASAIKLIRDARGSQALSNTDFVSFLENFHRLCPPRST